MRHVHKIREEILTALKKVVLKNATYRRGVVVFYSILQSFDIAEFTARRTEKSLRTEHS